ncbi:MAG TPA: EAL domain-containing protein [Steroidobacteraceae bacterium]|jgi:PAS domain S-box-containing protein/diguanylate cyclase (GGDEF)-like protein|nr:EAL domain-containing protein [Steroidobacteraceae bacterium]
MQPVRVVLVEDMPMEAEIAIRQLESGGFSCNWKRVDSEAVLRQALIETKPDLILSDFTLPGFDGLSALEIARELVPHTPFIFLSGTIGEERAIDALQRGAYDYVLKTNMARLVPAVRRALDDASIRRARSSLEQQLRDIVATSQDWIWEHDRDGKFTFCSDSVRSILGYSPDEILGTNASQYIHPEDLAALDFATHTLGPSQRTAINLQARWRHRNGSYRWLERNMLALLDENGRVMGFRGSERDFSERRRQEKHISRLTRVLKMLSGVNSAMVRIRQRREILVEACRLATSVGGYASAMVALIEPGTRTARPTAWSGSVDSQSAQQLTFSIADSAGEDSSVMGRVLRTGVSMVCNDLQQLDMGLAARASLMDSGFRSVVAYPLLVDRTPVGALMLTSYDVGAVGDEESRMLRELVANLSFALQYLHKEDEVRFLSYFDPLTGLAKRGLFCERLLRALEPRIGRRGTPAVAVLDIEQLSSINDSFGRHAGDLLLQQVADRLKRHMDTTELLAHFGAGTFGLIMEAAGDEDEAVHWLQEQVAEVFRAPFVVDGRGIPVDVKCGFARYPDNGNDANALVQNAEAALRSAKSTGEKYLPHRLELSSAVVSRMTMEHRLRAAVERQEFELHYQPKVDVRTRTIRGLEALVRWRDPEAGLVMPGAFLPLIETSGLIVPLGDWILRQAASDLRRWLGAGLSPGRVAVNISPIQLRRRSFADHLLDIVGEWRNESSGIDIEITEGVLIDDVSSAVSQLRVLRRSGIRVAIDDFGTGYSSLSRLAELPVDMLKIDRSFISGLTASGTGRTVAETIIALGKAFDMTTVAEGVETPEQFEMLAKMGCDQSQGYLHGRPMAAADIEPLLRNGSTSGTYLAIQPGMKATPMARRG